MVWGTSYGVGGGGRFEAKYLVSETCPRPGKALCPFAPRGLLGRVREKQTNLPRSTASHNANNQQTMREAEKEAVIGFSSDADVANG
jgi:hypothetical protein